jgi:hypothetical protein
VRYKITNSQLSKENLKDKKNWSRVPDGRLTPRLTGRLTVGCNVTSTLTLDRLSGLVVRVLGYTTEMYSASCDVRTKFIYVM